MQYTSTEGLSVFTLSGELNWCSKCHTTGDVRVHCCRALPAQASLYSALFYGTAYSNLLPALHISSQEVWVKGLYHQVTSWVSYQCPPPAHQQPPPLPAALDIWGAIPDPCSPSCNTLSVPPGSENTSQELPLMPETKHRGSHGMGFPTTQTLPLAGGKTKSKRKEKASAAAAQKRTCPALTAHLTTGSVQNKQNQKISHAAARVSTDPNLKDSLKPNGRALSLGSG